MQQIVLVIHLLIALALVGTVLIQRSEGGGLGMGGGAGSMTSTRSSGNLLTRTTAVLAACFMATNIILAILAGGRTATPPSIVDQIPQATETPAPSQEPAVPLGD